MADRYDNWRMHYHLTPPKGWINDPNGLCQKDGVYHVFFQYWPDYPQGSTRGWGHYQSRDLLNWEFTGMPILPDSDLDRDGAYSGSALVENNMIHLFYTGNVKEPGDHDYTTSGRLAPTIHIATRDGIHMGAKECVLDNGAYPEGYTCHIRDPKVWKTKTGYGMILGARTSGDEGNALLYDSSDLHTWHLRQILADPDNDAYMWECPDLFAVGGETLLSISPQGMAREQYRLQNLYQSGYYRMANQDEKYEIVAPFEQWDYGFDFYAPQTFADEQGRRILIGWMGLPDIENEYDNPTLDRGWIHALTMAREITVQDHIIRQLPLAEYEELRENERTVNAQKCAPCNSAAQIRVDNSSGTGFALQIDPGIEMIYDANNGVFTLRFTGSEGAGRTSRSLLVQTLKSLRIYLDASALEIYLNEGERVLTTRYYPKEDVRTFTIESGDCKAVIWDMRSQKVIIDNP